MVISLLSTTSEKEKHRGRCRALLLGTDGRMHRNVTKLHQKDQIGHHEKFLYCEDTGTLENAS